MSEDLGRLRWQCRRGMKELDLLLTRYLERGFPRSSPPQQAQFRLLLELPDPVLQGYFLGRDTPADPALLLLIESITNGARNGG